MTYLGFAGWDLLDGWIDNGWYGRRWGLGDPQLVSTPSGGSAVLLDERAVSAALMVEVRRNPTTVFCKTRKCSHRASAHNAAGVCMVEGCECEGLTLPAE